MALTQEQIRDVAALIDQGLATYTAGMRPMYEQLMQGVTALTAQGSGGTNTYRKSITESLSKRVDAFKNSGFENWQFKIITATRAVSDEGYKVLEKGKEAGDTSVPDDWASSQGPRMDEANREIYFALTEKTEGEAFDIVRNVQLQNGAEAWRRLLVRFDSHTLGKEILLARKVVSPPKIKQLKDIAAHLDKWDESVRKLETEYKCNVDESLQKAILLEMLPTSMLEGVMARIDKSAATTSIPDLK